MKEPPASKILPSVAKAEEAEALAPIAAGSRLLTATGGHAGALAVVLDPTCCSASPKVSGIGSAVSNLMPSLL